MTLRVFRAGAVLATLFAFESQAAAATCRGAGTAGDDAGTIECPSGAPVCVYGACVGCTADYGAGGIAQCPTSANPFCTGTGADGGAFDGGDGGSVGPGGTCGTCMQNGGDVGCASATAVHTGTKCAASGACSIGCANDTDCKASEFCEGQTGACSAKIADGMPLPAGDTCDSLTATRECVSAVCDPATNLCGAAPPPALDASAQGDATVPAEGGTPSAPLGPTYTVGGGCACDATGADADASSIAGALALVGAVAARIRRGSRSRVRASSSRSRGLPPST